MVVGRRGLPAAVFRHASSPCTRNCAVTEHLFSLTPAQCTMAFKHPDLDMCYLLRVITHFGPRRSGSRRTFATSGMHARGRKIWTMPKRWARTSQSSSQSSSQFTQGALSNTSAVEISTCSTPSIPPHAHTTRLQPFGEVAPHVCFCVVAFAVDIARLCMLFWAAGV